MDHIPEISQLAAAALRDALTAAERGDVATALGHLLSIDAASWDGIKARFADLGGLPGFVPGIPARTDRAHR